MKIYSKLNFHKHTYCEYKIIDKDFFIDKPTHYKSKSGSQYYFTELGVYRYSNHWGRVGNCSWKINNVKDYKNQNYYIGYAGWKDFFPLNSSEKLFYLKVDFSTGKAKICIKKEHEISSRFLMNIDLATKRLKEIKILFKDYKWATYYSSNIELVRRQLVYKLLESDTSILELKQHLKNDFK